MKKLLIVLMIALVLEGCSDYKDGLQTFCNSGNGVGTYTSKELVTSDQDGKSIDTTDYTFTGVGTITSHYSPK